MEATWLGHATVRVALDGTTLLTDPAVRRRISGLVRHAPLPSPHATSDIDAVLVSHAHHDHLDLPSLERLGPDVRILVPRGLGRLLEARGFRHLTELEVGDVARIDDLRVTAIPANHAGSRLPLGPRAAAIGYLVEGSRSVYFAGDTGLFPQMAMIHPALDLALMPVGGWGPFLRGGHLNPTTAAIALTLLRPRRAVPIHWGTFWPTGMRWVGARRFTDPGREFHAQAARLVPEVEVVVLAPGEGLTVPAA